MFNFFVNFGKVDLLFVLAMLPIIILGLIIYKKDVREKEPLSLLIKLFLFGMISTGVALFFEISMEKIFSFMLFKNYFGIFIKSFLIIALVEETVKWIFTYFFCWNEKAFNYTYDAIVYCVFIALGFACIENMIAVFSKGGGIILALKRGIITVPAHVFFAISSGYYLGKSKRFFSRRWNNKGKKYLIISIIYPILLHGIFDFLLFSANKLTLIISVIFIVYLYINSYFILIRASKEEKPIKN